ncbi:MAG: GlsB/YeaQ/YmgE family stress response membrane protein [Archangiaceae bacterium]|nr:GlsB/YeaQ/YmgE family stress response membrane protein [Archangiaceae bacterium]
MSIIAFLVVGLVAGLIARAIVPGGQGMSLPRTMALGIGGSFIGGFIHSMIYSRGNWMEFHPTGLIFSVIGATTLLLLIMLASHRRLPHP